MKSVRAQQRWFFDPGPSLETELVPRAGLRQVQRPIFADAILFSQCAFQLSLDRVIGPLAV